MQALEGSQAIARAVARCRPQVIAAYPITPQTHIVEGISKLVADGVLDAEVVSVESEFSAASVVLGAAAAGVRAYTATSSQGILLMSEVLFNIAGQRIPLVLTCANRAVGAPLSIWNDHSDAMAVRDAGWVQLWCQDNQSAVDTTIQAFRIAERIEVPVMVCVDGFVLTHTLEPLAVPDVETVDRFLPPYAFSRTLDVQAPISMGTLVTPAHFSELRHAHQVAMQRALAEIESADADYEALTGRRAGGLLTIGGKPEAKTGVLALGSATQTFEAAVEADASLDVRIINLRAFRPFPAEALRAACADLDHLVVVDRAISTGAGGIVATEVQATLADMSARPRVHSVAAGLGGRDIPLDLLGKLVAPAALDRAQGFRIADANLELLPEEDR